MKTFSVTLLVALGLVAGMSQAADPGPGHVPSGSPSATTTISGKQLPAPEPAFGGVFPDPQELRRYAAVIHCGGCMIHEQKLRARVLRLADAGVPVTNYGLAIAHSLGILAVSYTHLRAHETVLDLVCRLLLEKKKHTHIRCRAHK